MESLPLYLLTPSTTAIVAPPLDTKRQELPIEQLAWEDFERLCLRLVQVQSAVSASELYGTKGQDQQGIDIFVEKQTGKYATYQCKRYELMTVATLKSIVELFKQGRWVKKSDEFVICTTAALNTTQLQDAFIELRDGLTTQGIVFSKWDKVQLQVLLKQQPAIVYDFFGKEWVKLFNGAEAYERLNPARRLDNRRVVAYRQELSAFYSSVFNHYDPGLAIQELNTTPFLLQERFILPDVYEQKGPSAYAASPSQAAQATAHAVERKQDMYTSRLLHREGNALQGRSQPDDDYRKTVKSRIRFDLKLVQHKRNIVIGDPGAGKSTLLRYLTLDLLSSEPVLEAVAHQLDARLPVWLPFAYVTKQLTLNANYSLSELLHLWFSSMDQAHLFDLVQEALQDERLVLLIDGVDEWNSFAAAEQAIAKIEIQASLQGTPVIYSSRPYGYKLLKDCLPNIQQLELAPFSRPQQRAFVRGWYRQWLLAIEPSGADRAAAETDTFFAELDKSSDLKHLAENALLLSILVTQKLRDSVLPRNRLKALQDITDYLINRHPSKRRREAGIIDEPYLDFELDDVFSELAFHIQQHSNDGAIAKQDAARVVERYLSRMMNYEPAKAKKLGRELVDLSANSIGIIMEKSNDEIAFRHRQFQEYLAAKYLYESDKAVVFEHLQAYAAEQTWNQVILTFFALIPAKKISAFTDFLAQVTYAGPDRVKGYYTRFLRYDICLRLTNSPIHTAQQALGRVQHDFEVEQDEAIKQLLLQLLLSAAENPKLKGQVFDYLGTYFPNTFKYNDYRVQALRAVAPALLSDRQKEFVVNALINGNTTTKLSASLTLGKFIPDEWVQAQVMALLTKQTRADLRAFALNALVGAPLSHEAKAAALAEFTGQATGKTLLFATKLKVALGTQTDQDLEQLLAAANGFETELEEELVSLLATGWPTSQALCDTGLACVNKNATERRKLRPAIAWKVLFHSFNTSELVIDRVIEELETENLPFIPLENYHGWQYLAHYFKDSPRLLPVIDQWMVKQEHRDPETAFAGLVGRTPVARQYLLDKLGTSSGPQWPMMALLDGWADDPHVQTQLKAYFRSDTKNRDSAAHYVGRVFREEAAEGVAILESILFDRRLLFRERAVLPLIQLDRGHFEAELLGPFVEQELPLLSKDFLAQYYSCLETLVEHFQADDRVKALLFDERNWQDVYFTDLLIRYYPSATAAIDQILGHSRPLAAKYRLQMVEKLGERYAVDEQSLARLALFDNESDDLIRCEGAVRYFKGAKDAYKDDIRRRCTALAFYRGISYEANRQIAFIGFLIIGELTAYFSLRDESENKPKPDFNFEDGFHKHESPLIKVMVEHFVPLHGGINGNFAAISRFGDPSDLQGVWGAFAKYSATDSPTVPYVLEFVEQHADSIGNPELLALLAEAAPGSNALKKIAWRMLQSRKPAECVYAGAVLGQQFTTHVDVTEYVSDIQDAFLDTGKIVAACIGWPDLPVLKAVFEEVVASHSEIDPYAAYQLKFLFRDTANIMEFLERVLADFKEASYQHQYFSKPLLARLKRDQPLQQRLLSALLSTENAAHKISYYALLTHANAHATDLAAWKEAQQPDMSSYGYNIVENRMMSLSESVHDIWY